MADLWFATGQDIKEADGVMIMYSVASTASLQEAVQMKGYVTRKRFEREMEQTESNASIIPLILVGVDHGIKKREIPWEDGTATHTHTRGVGSTIDGGAGKEVALSWQCPFAEITRDQTKISKSFEELVKEIYRYGRAPSLRCSLHPRLP